MRKHIYEGFSFIKFRIKLIELTYAIDKTYREKLKTYDINNVSEFNDKFDASLNNRDEYSLLCDLFNYLFQ